MSLHRRMYNVRIFGLFSLALAMLPRATFWIFTAALYLSETCFWCREGIRPWKLSTIKEVQRAKLHKGAACGVDDLQSDDHSLSAVGL